MPRALDGALSARTNARREATASVSGRRYSASGRAKTVILLAGKNIAVLPA